MKEHGVTMYQAATLLAHRFCLEEGIEPRVSDEGEWMFPAWVIDRAIQRADADMRDGTIWETLVESILVIDPNVTEGNA